MLQVRQCRPTTHPQVPNRPTATSVGELIREDMEGRHELADMAPSWQPPAPLLDALVTAPCTRALSRLTTAGQTSSAHRYGSSPARQTDQQNFISNNTRNY
jgi:hypothetical protein